MKLQRRQLRVPAIHEIGVGGYIFFYAQVRKRESAHRGPAAAARRGSLPVSGYRRLVTVEFTGRGRQDFHPECKSDHCD
eukprot:1635008-Rhodomonas_salina.2